MTAIFGNGSRWESVRCIESKMAMRGVEEFESGFQSSSFCDSTKVGLMTRILGWEFLLLGQISNHKWKV